MTPDEFDRLMRRLQGAYPRMVPAQADARSAQREAWFSALRHHDFDRALTAVSVWVSERRNPPSVSDVVEGIRAMLRRVEARAHEAAAPVHRRNDAPCPECEDSGFTFVSFAGPGTVVRCRRGCIPRLPTDHHFHDRPGGEPSDPAASIRTARDVLSETRGRLRRPVGVSS